MIDKSKLTPGANVTFAIPDGGANSALAKGKVLEVDGESVRVQLANERVQIVPVGLILQITAPFLTRFFSWLGDRLFKK